MGGVFLLELADICINHYTHTMKKSIATIAALLAFAAGLSAQTLKEVSIPWLQLAIDGDMTGLRHYTVLLPEESEDTYQIEEKVATIAEQYCGYRGTYESMKETGSLMVEALRPLLNDPNLDSETRNTYKSMINIASGKCSSKDLYYVYDPAEVLAEVKKLALNNKVYGWVYYIGKGIWLETKEPYFCNAYNTQITSTWSDPDGKIYCDGAIDESGRTILPEVYYFDGCDEEANSIFATTVDKDGHVIAGAFTYDTTVKVPFTNRKWCVSTADWFALFQAQNGLWGAMSLDCKKVIVEAKYKDYSIYSGDYFLTDSAGNSIPVPSQR